MVKINLKTSQEVALAAESGKILGRIMGEVFKKIKPGLNTLEINDWIEEKIIRSKAKASFKLVPGYHWAACIGVNDEVVHSIPRKDKIIKKGDLLKIDAGVYWKGFHSDASWTVLVGDSKFDIENSKFLEAGKMALKKAIQQARPGNRIGHISQAIQQTIEKAGYSPVKVLTGHGIGRKLHEEPFIPGVLKGKIEKTEPILPGMLLAVEVIYNQGKAEVIMENDGWTISTKDGKMSGLFEETIAVGENGPLTLTRVGDFLC
jgi:methionyl aminopeptidase